MPTRMETPPRASASRIPTSSAHDYPRGEPTTSPTRDRPTISRQFSHRRGTSSTVTPSPTALATNAVAIQHARPKTSSSAQVTSPIQFSQGGSYFVNSPGTPAGEPRSPGTRRPPASRSSHGIETSSGPPPALSTQRTYSTETAWRISSPVELVIPHSKLTPRNLADPDGVNDSHSRGIDSIVNDGIDTSKRSVSPPKISSASQEPTGLRDDSKGATNDSENNQSPAITDDKSRSLHKLEGMESPTLIHTMRKDSESKPKAHEQQSQSIQEDLFYDLAQTDTSPGEVEEVPSRSERRRSRILLSGTRQSLLLSDSQTGSNGRNIDEVYNPPPISGRRSSLQRAEQSSQIRAPSSAERYNQKDRLFAASAHPLDQRQRNRLLSGTPKPTFASVRSLAKQETLPESSNFYSRGSTVTESSSALPRAYRHSNLSNIASGHYHSSPLTSRSISVYEHDSAPVTIKAEGTESTVSTTAPSTVWDELDDLKSRIKKLELTGRLPTSSGAAISSAAGERERPPTATTTMTTMSTSPNRGTGHSGSPGESVLGSMDDTSMHPLLHSALAKSKTLINSDIYRALEATATDALTLAKMTKSTSSQSTTSAAIDRQLKRKADSMCRSLTELAISLSSPISPLPPSRGRDVTTLLHRSREASVELESPNNRFRRNASLEPSDDDPTARVLSRLEARRSSMIGLASQTPPREQHLEIAIPTQQPASSAPAASSSRTTTVLQRVRRTIDDRDNAGARAAGEDRTVRPLSRAMTELHSRSQQRQQQALSAREYVSQHPLPKDSPGQSTPQSGLPRRSYFSQPQLPSTPTAVIATSRARGDRSTSSSVEARQQRFASLSGRYGVGGSGKRARGASEEPRERGESVD